MKEAKLVLFQWFNKLLDAGVYPDEWSSAIIFPIHKKDDVNIPDNYRGMSLISCVRKVFTEILNNGLIS